MTRTGRSEAHRRGSGFQRGRDRHGPVGILHVGRVGHSGSTGRQVHTPLPSFSIN